MSVFDCAVPAPPIEVFQLGREFAADSAPEKVSLGVVIMMMIMMMMMQVVKSSRMIWCCLISVPVFGRRPRWFQCLGMTVIVCGLFVKASVMFQDIFPDYREIDHCQKYVNITGRSGLTS